MTIGGSNIGIRMFLIGKDGVLAGLREVTVATRQMNAEMAKSNFKQSELGLLSLGNASTYSKAQIALYEQELVKANAAQDALARVGKVAFFGLAAATAAWSYESIKWAKDYQSELLKIQTQAGRTAGAMNQIGAAAMAQAGGLGISPTTYVTAAYHPASMQMPVPEVLAVTRYGAQAAAIAGSDVEQTVDTLGGVVLAYKRNAGQVGQTAAQLNAIVGQGNMRYSQLNQALHSGLMSTAQTFGVSLTSVGAALAYLTDLQVPAAQAGTRLRMGLTLLGAPTAESAKLLGSLSLDTTTKQNAQSAAAQLLAESGVTTTQLQYALNNNRGGGGIYNALELLHQRLAASGMDPELQRQLIGRAFGGGRMGAAIIQMYQNLPRLYQKNLQIEGAGSPTKFNQDWIKTTQTLHFELHRLGGELQTLGTTYGLALLPYLTKVSSATATFLNFLAHHRGVAMALGTAITAVLAPAIGLYLYRALLGNEHALGDVFRAYGRLLGRQSQEATAAASQQRILAASDASFEENTGVINANAGAYERLSLAERGGGRLGGGLGLPGGTVPTTAEGRAASLGFASRFGAAAGTWGVGGLIASQLIKGNQGYTVNQRAGVGGIAQSIFGSAAAGAGIGATVGSIIPGVGTGIGAGIGAAGGAIYAERQPISHAIASAWDSLFGGGTSSTAVPRQRAHIVAHVYIDGKEVTSAVVKNVKATAARQ